MCVNVIVSVYSAYVFICVVSISSVSAPPLCVCVFCSALWSTGQRLHCSSASSSPVESPFPPPSHAAANESQGRLLGNSVAQPAQDSESEDEFGPNSFLVKTGSGTLYATAAAAAASSSAASADGEFVDCLLQTPLLLTAHCVWLLWLLWLPGCTWLGVSSPLLHFCFEVLGFESRNYSCHFC